MKPVFSTLMAFSVVGSLLVPPVRAALPFQYQNINSLNELTGYLASSWSYVPPQYQNVKDLEVMVNYVKANPDVAGTLKSIDLENKTVNYGKDCQATFERKPSTKLMG